MSDRLISVIGSFIPGPNRWLTAVHDPWNDPRDNALTEYHFAENPTVPDQNFKSPTVNTS